MSASISATLTRRHKAGRGAYERMVATIGIGFLRRESRRETAAGSLGRILCNKPFCLRFGSSTVHQPKVEAA